MGFLLKLFPACAGLICVEEPVGLDGRVNGFTTPVYSSMAGGALIDNRTSTVWYHLMVPLLFSLPPTDRLKIILDL